MQIDHVDHLVLTVQNIPATCEFYSRVLGMHVVTFAEGRMALQFGNQKINLHDSHSANLLVVSAAARCFFVLSEPHVAHDSDLTLFLSQVTCVVNLPISAYSSVNCCS